MFEKRAKICGKTFSALFKTCGKGFSACFRHIWARVLFFPYGILTLSFPQKYGNELLPVWREIGMGFFLYEWRSHEYRKKNFLTNHEWLNFNSPRMALQEWWNKNSPRAAKPQVGNFYFITTAKPWVGNYYWAMSDEWGNLTIPIFLKTGYYIPIK